MWNHYSFLWKLTIRCQVGHISEIMIKI